MKLKITNWGVQSVVNVGVLRLTDGATPTVTTNYHLTDAGKPDKMLKVTGTYQYFQENVLQGDTIVERFRYGENAVDSVEWDDDATAGLKYHRSYHEYQYPYGEQLKNQTLTTQPSFPQAAFCFVEDMRPFNPKIKIGKVEITVQQRTGYSASIMTTVYNALKYNNADIRWDRGGREYTPYLDNKTVETGFLCECDYNGTKYIGLMLLGKNGWTDNLNTSTWAFGNPDTISDFLFFGLQSELIESEIAEMSYGDESAPDGGYNGTFDDTSENVGFTDDTSDVFSQIITAENRGFHVYSIDNIQYNDLISDFMKHNQSLSIFNKEPWESILGVYKLPFTVNLTAENFDVQANGYVIKDENDVEVQAPQVAETTRTVNIGEISVQPYFDNYMDFSPYTKAQVYLPFIGFRDLPINDIMGGSVKIEYRFDVLTGNCVALIYCKNRFGMVDITASYTGNCAVQLPMYGNKGNSGQLLGAIAGITAGVLTENVGAVAGGAMGLATMQNSPNVSSQYNGNMGILSNRQCYLIITRNVPSIPENFEKYRGYTSDITTKISDLTGYTKFSDIHVDEIEGATADEKEEIERILKTGFIA